ncbi:hypothetical protein AFK71_10890 [Virgibacillus pantothenticus]|uniref:DUF3310 domain-containing protein n=2 Tax=Virgibacillus pantothenticus TaxID=1473 RepID=A0A0L0QRP8_VIRPA|nr:hypothetical protein AFK71_10890 [Virgibacillus pantothenticus]
MSKLRNLRKFILKDDIKSYVNHPPHYQGKTEVIEIIEQATEDLKGIKAVCTGNIVKYIMRHTKKNGVEDLLKARWYLDRLIEEYEKEGNNND